MKESDTQSMTNKVAPPEQGGNGLGRPSLGTASSPSMTSARLGLEVKKLEKIIDKLKRVELQEFTNYLHSPWRILWANFLAGTARGLGFLIGATLVLTAAGLIVSKVLGNIPFVGDFFQAANHWIETTIQQSKPH